MSGKALYAVLRCFAAHYDSTETALSMLLTYVSPAYWTRRLWNFLVKASL